MNGLGQRPSYVSETTGLGERDYFGRQKKNLEVSRRIAHLGDSVVTLLGHKLTSGVKRKT
jgi:hypothetical protein